jgi:muramoyltetrapeptide carboxypeptidase
MVRIGVVAAGSAMTQDVADEAAALAAELYPGRVELVVHPNSFLRSGHFAGTDDQRAQAVLDIANDESFDALWFGRGGYGACRIAETVLAGLGPAAARKAYLGYSDAGVLLAALYTRGFTRLAHGPVVQDIRRENGREAATRALAWLVDSSRDALEPTVLEGAPTAAFNITILSQLLGTPLQPDLAGHVLMLEEVSEHMYRIDRSLFHITANPEIRKVAGIKLGRCSDIPLNDPDFGRDEEAVAREWCARSGIPWLGRADIGHDARNRIVPFGRAEHVRRKWMPVPPPDVL